MLREIEGLTTEECAECLNLTVANVKVRLHRARTQLREYLLKVGLQNELFEFGNARCDRLTNRVMSQIRQD